MTSEGNWSLGVNEAPQPSATLWPPWIPLSTPLPRNQGRAGLGVPSTHLRLQMQPGSSLSMEARGGGGRCWGPWGQDHCQAGHGFRGFQWPSLETETGP